MHTWKLEDKKKEEEKECISLIVAVGAIYIYNNYTNEVWMRFLCLVENRRNAYVENGDEKWKAKSCGVWELWLGLSANIYNIGLVNNNNKNNGRRCDVWTKEKKRKKLTKRKERTVEVSAQLKKKNNI